MPNHLKKIEEELLPEIEVAAIKGNMNRVIAALRASLAELVNNAKEMNVALSALNGTPTSRKTPVRKSTKKVAPKKADKTAE